MPRLALLLLALLGALLPCSAAKPRTRKELRSLTEHEYQLFLQGLSTLLSVSTETGQKIYGKKYKNYYYFVTKHAVAASDPRGDQGHFGPAFMTFHRAWLLELESALLSVVPGLPGLPYLDIVQDLKGGKYYNTSKYIYGTKYAGPNDCASGTANKCQVESGPFAWQFIPYFNDELYSSTAYIYNGSSTTGLLRGATNANSNAYLTRYPVKNIINFLFTFEGNGFTTAGEMWLNNVTGLSAGTSGWNYTAEDYERCLNASSFVNWIEWTWCVDWATFTVSHTNGAEFDRYTSNMSPSLHSSVHWLTGGISDSGTQGDMFDLITSPNEALLFLMHHANIDRSAMTWQANAQRLNSTLADASVLWGYPASYASYPYSNSGCYLHDVINSNFPFTSGLFSDESKASGYTHYDILNKVRPGKLYRYL